MILLRMNAPSTASHGEKANKFATVSMALGLASIPLAFVCCIGFATALVAVVLAVIALIEANRTGDARAKKRAIIGIVASVLAPIVYFAVLAVLVAVGNRDANGETPMPSLPGIELPATE